MASEGKTVAKTNGMVIFLQGGAPGDTVEAEVTKIKSSYMEGRVTSIQQLSPHRANPFCIHFGTCGGCSWQHIDYETQLFYKQKQVVDNLERIGGLAAIRGEVIDDCTMARAVKVKGAPSLARCRFR